MTCGWENTDARSVMPLFHTQPKGYPSIVQRNSGRFTRLAFRRACHKSNSQGICVQRSSSGLALIKACNSVNVCGRMGEVRILPMFSGVEIMKRNFLSIYEFVKDTVTRLNWRRNLSDSFN